MTKATSMSSPSAVAFADLPNTSVLIDRLAQQLKAQIAARGWQNPALVGIHSGGVWVAQALRDALAVDWPLGQLDISFYRDDYTRIGLNPSVKSSALGFSPEGRQLILIDDVIMSGRTIRAALNELFDFGRPDAVMLVTLLSLPGRELPIQPDLCAAELLIAADERVKLSGPSPLSLSCQSLSKPPAEPIK